MSDLKDSRIVIAGAGVFAAVSTLVLSRLGARVIQVAPRPDPGCASLVAAGMIAPALESALDPASAGHFAFLKSTRDLWPGLAAELPGVGIDRSGAILRGAEDHLRGRAASLTREGARVEVRDGELFTPEDWRVDAEAMLAAIAARSREIGARYQPGRIVSARGREAVLDDGDRLEADAVILATGHGGLSLAPELAALQPIRGHILKFQGGPATGPVIRGGGYLAPHPTGALVGATMEPGQTALAPDESAVNTLRDIAAALDPDLAGRPFEVRVGVRPATPDGMPMVGRSVTGAWIANGARRNGWLLAPLVAQELARALRGGQTSPRFAPGRFTAAGSSPGH